MHNNRFYNYGRQGCRGSGHVRGRGRRGAGFGPWQNYETAPENFGPPPWAQRWGWQEDMPGDIASAGLPPWAMGGGAWSEDRKAQLLAWLEARKARLLAWKQQLETRLAETEAEIEKMNLADVTAEAE